MKSLQLKSTISNPPLLTNKLIPMIKTQNLPSPVTNDDNYGIIVQLYYLNKKKKAKPRLPVNDFRGAVKSRVTNESRVRRISIRKALLKVAAMW